jgi:hypothetical protein
MDEIRHTTHSQNKKQLHLGPDLHGLFCFDRMRLLKWVLGNSPELARNTLLADPVGNFVGVVLGFPKGSVTPCADHSHISSGSGFRITGAAEE